MNRLTCFKAYDIRGKLGEQLNEEIAYRIGRAFAYTPCLVSSALFKGCNCLLITLK